MVLRSACMYNVGAHHARSSLFPGVKLSIKKITTANRFQSIGSRNNRGPISDTIRPSDVCAGVCVHAFGAHIGLKEWLGLLGVKSNNNKTRPSHTYIYEYIYVINVMCK
jgi:hypothetical protein